MASETYVGSILESTVIQVQDLLEQYRFNHFKIIALEKKKTPEDLIAPFRMLKNAAREQLEKIVGPNFQDHALVWAE